MNPNCFKATYQADEVWFTLDESYRDNIPPDAIAYTLAEAQILAERSEWTKRMVHETKKLTPARVVIPTLPTHPHRSSQYSPGSIH